jgi:hypothetical protein
MKDKCITRKQVNNYLDKKLEFKKVTNHYIAMIITASLGGLICLLLFYSYFNSLGATKTISLNELEGVGVISLFFLLIICISTIFYAIDVLIQREHPRI